jgi:hypothetical protein
MVASRVVRKTSAIAARAAGLRELDRRSRDPLSGGAPARRRPAVKTERRVSLAGVGCARRRYDTEAGI